MEIWKGRPEITPTDHPTTVYKAIEASFSLWNREHPDEYFAWIKKAQDAEGALWDGFRILDPYKEPWRPDGRARLYMSVDELEYTLVGYGVRQIELDPERNAEEIRRVDEVLKAIDKALDRKKH